MAFSFANVAAGLTQDNMAVKVQDGPDLQSITTDQLGFSAINGDAKVRLLSNPWPEDSLPIPSASLFAVASSQGLLAAAGPDTLVIVKTGDVRDALSEKAGDQIRKIEPLLTVPHSQLMHVGFTADESALIVSEAAAGITGYQVDRLKEGKAEVALRIETNNTGLRSLVTNPAVQTAQLVACVTSNGELMIADLSKGKLIEGLGGSVLMKKVNCVSWSNKGKQLVAGLSDGTAVQLKPDGTEAARIPKSTSVPNDVHISAISWLETHSFLVVYTPNSISLDEGIPTSEYYIVNREGSQYTFHHLPEIVPSFGLERVPTHHFIARLRDWKPHLLDLVILTASTASEIGMISKTDQPLNPDQAVSDSYTLVEISNDSRRAALPLSSDMADTSPIGMGLDLSATTGVANPIPSDPEIEETQGPVPNLLVLNHEGILSSWWIIYDDSVRQKTTYSGFSALSTMEQARSAVSLAAQSSPSPIPTHNDQAMESESSPSQPTEPLEQPSQSTQSPFAAPSTTFGGLTSQSTFGTGSGFNTSSAIGESKSSWTSTGFGSSATNSATTSSSFGKPAFGQTTFGTSSTLGGGGTNAPAFGTAGTMGNRPSPFGQSNSSPAAAFGQTGFSSKPAGGIFGAGSSTSPFAAADGLAAKSGFASGSTTNPFAAASGSSSNSGFGSFVAKSPFGGATSDKNGGTSTSPFAKVQQGETIFGQGASSQSPFSRPAGGNMFAQPATHDAFSKSSALGSSSSTTNNTAFGNTSFKLDSSFKGDGSAKDDLPKPSGGFGFDSGFGSLLEDTSKAQPSPTHDKEEDMEDESEDQKSSDEKTDKPFSEHSSETNMSRDHRSKSLVTPPSTISQSKSNPAPPVSNVFNLGRQQLTTPQPTGGERSFSFAPAETTTPKDTPVPVSTIFGPKSAYQPDLQTASQNEPSGSLQGKEDVTAEQVTPKASKSGDEDLPKIKTESPSDDDVVNIKKIPEAPLPPDPRSKLEYQTGDTSASSLNSSRPDDAPLPPDFLPANKSAVSDAEQVELPGLARTEDDGGDDAEGEEDDKEEEESQFSSDFDESGEDITGDVSPAEEEDEQGDETATEHVQTSPESSFRGENTTSSFASPTGGLFTKVSTSQQPKLGRPALFGEIGSAPIFPPPKPQQSPRSPSPVRQSVTGDSLRSDMRAVSAPVRQRSAIDQRKSEYLQSGIAAKATQARDQEAARERARLDALKQAQEQARGREMHALEDDEDERVQRELAEPIRPTKALDAFITYEPSRTSEAGKTDIPAQIERLFQDINCMVYTLGINARSLSSFLAYQQDSFKNESWPAVLESETPMDAWNDTWLLQEIGRLHEGCAILEQSVQRGSVDEIDQKLERCQMLLVNEISDLRNKVTALRKSIYARMHGSTAAAPLTAEQASIQNDLRKTASTVQTNLVTVEDSLTVLRARLSDIAPSDGSNGGNNFSANGSRKPTVEAVTNTVLKMTSMAEKRSADVDVLELQLKRLGLIGTSAVVPSTPPSTRTKPASTPGSATSSVYHTPESNTGGSARSARYIMGSGKKPGPTLVSIEDRQRWEAKNKRRRDVGAALRAALEGRQKSSA